MKEVPVQAPGATDLLACYCVLAGGLPSDRTESVYDLKSVIITILTTARCAGAEHEEHDMLADAVATHGPLH